MIGWVSCADCGIDLPFYNDSPCPKCGSKNRIIRTDNTKCRNCGFDHGDSEECPTLEELE